MIRLTNESRILLAIAPADFRAGIDGMSARCRLVLEQDPKSGTIFCFTNRARTMVRALVYDGNGFWLMTKRLSRGTFQHWPRSEDALSTVSARELTRLLQCEAGWQPVPAQAIAQRQGTPVVRAEAVPTPVDHRPCTLATMDYGSSTSGQLSAT